MASFKPPSTGDGKIAVSTILGTSIISKSDFVHVKIGGPDGGFVKKPASQLLMGEEVLFRKDGIPGLTIEQAEDALRKSTRYASKQAQLFTLTIDGEKKPVFQQALLEGMTFKSELWPIEILKAATFSAQTPAGEIVINPCAASEFIHSVLVESGISHAVSADHIEHSWLTGKVVAPQDYEMVARALSDIAPGILKLIEPEFGLAYRFYVSVRQAVMRAVNNILVKSGKPNSKSNRPDYSSNEPEKLSPEIQMVIDHFASDISSKYFGATVLGLNKENAPSPASSDQPVIKRARNGSKTEPATGLFKGIVTEHVGDDEIKIKPLPLVSLECNMIEGISMMAAGIMLIDHYTKQDPNYLARIRSNKKAAEDLAEETKLLKCEISNALGYQDRHRSEINRRITDLHLKMFDKTFLYRQGCDRAITGIAKSACEKLLSCEADRRFKLPEGTLVRLFEYEAKLRAALPNDLFYLLTLDIMIDYKKNILHLKFGDRKKEEAERENLLKDAKLAAMYAQMKHHPALSEARNFLNAIGLSEIGNIRDLMSVFNGGHERGRT